MIATEEIYIGCTENLMERLSDHNNGSATHTKKYRPWKIISYHVFEDKLKAFEFEKYLKSHSGRAFAQKRLL